MGVRLCLHKVLAELVHGSFIKDITERVKIYSTNEKKINYNELTNEQRIKLSKRLEKEMKTLAKSMEFEKAALIRDQLIDLRTSVK